MGVRGCHVSLEEKVEGVICLDTHYVAEAILQNFGLKFREPYTRQSFCKARAIYFVR